MNSKLHSGVKASSWIAHAMGWFIKMSNVLITTTAKLYAFKLQGINILKIEPAKVKTGIIVRV